MYLYVAGDCTRAYSRKKLGYFTRQIVFLRPGTFVIFDRVRAKRPELRKTWLLQAMKAPERIGPHLVVTNGRGRLFVQTVLPQRADVRLATGIDLYRYGGKAYPPKRDTGRAPECRIEVSPSELAAVDCFLHVLTATDADTTSVDEATATVEGGLITVSVADAAIVFEADQVGGHIKTADQEAQLASQIVE